MAAEVQRRGARVGLLLVCVIAGTDQAIEQNDALTALGFVQIFPQHAVCAGSPAARGLAGEAEIL